MFAGLTKTEVQQYRDHGYLFPLTIFDAAEVTDILIQMQRAREEGENKNLADNLDHYFRANAQLLMPFVSEIARTPQLLDKVESILGPDLILWSAEFFIKKAATDKIVSWHQDLTYWGLGETDNELTAWLALSDVSADSGCMRFLPGSHHQNILPHHDTFDASNLLSRGQEVAVEVDENDAVDVILKPGQMSFHHGRIFHASGPNRSKNNRIGLAFRFLTPEVKQLINKRDYAMLMRGDDHGGNWIHVEAPVSNFDAADLERYAEIKKDQSDALADGVEDGKMHAAFQTSQ